MAARVPTTHGHDPDDDDPHDDVHVGAASFALSAHDDPKNSVVDPLRHSSSSRVGNYSGFLKTLVHVRGSMKERASEARSRIERGSAALAQSPSRMPKQTNKVKQAGQMATLAVQRKTAVRDSVGGGGRMSQMSSATSAGDTTLLAYWQSNPTFQSSKQLARRVEYRGREVGGKGPQNPLF